MNVDSSGFDWDAGEYVDPDEATTAALVADAGSDDTPWYARPTDAILSVLGNITYRTDDYTIASRDGQLIVDRSNRSAAPAPVSQSPGLMQTLSRVPSVVWYGAGALVLLSMVRR